MAYSLLTSYAGESLLSGFNWINTVDPSHGYVAYQSQEDALAQGLYSVDSETEVVRLGVDHTNKYGLDQGRPSIRLESKEAYNHGLIIADFLHMPPSECGVWPAFWAYGANWPHGGELDIIEGANLAQDNIISGHTGDGCFLDPADDDLYIGTARNYDCAIGAQNIGCGYNPPANDTSSYGTNFNQVEGGVYAVQWDSDYLRVWHFPRDSIPADIQAKEPDPECWGLPEAIFGGEKCDVDSYYKDMNIVININFCGDFGEATWGTYPECKALASTCKEHVANSPEVFASAYWDVKYIDVYEATGSPSLSSSEGSAANNGAVTPEPTTTTTTTTTMTTLSTVFVTVPENAETTASPASNKAKVDEYTYLGCFRSSSGFRTFDLTLESSEMTVERCIEACDGIIHAGIFEKMCYCAEEIDKDTRALADPLSCDHVCPGGEDEFCGGLTGSQNNATARRLVLGRDAPSYYLLSVYADLKNDDDEALPPPMRPVPGSITPPAAQFVRTTTITYTIPCPTNPHTLMATEYVATVEDCSCTEQPSVPMETKVVDCQACGPKGEDTVTVTMPVTAVQNIELSAVPNLTPGPVSTPAVRLGYLNMTVPKRFQPSVATPEAPLQVSGSVWKQTQNTIVLAILASVICVVLV